MAAELSLTKTGIPGLLLLHLPRHPDSRGWFKEGWQREKMTALGLPDFGPVQQNVSFNTARGTVRGIHAEPWDKLISPSGGSFFGAWVDLREGPGFGTVFTAEIDESMAVFVPRGVGNAFQTLSDGLVYNYLVNDHWNTAAQYAGVNVADPALAIDWPIPLGDSIVSEKDLALPGLNAVAPILPPKTLILGANGQLGRALRQVFPDAAGVDIDTLDLGDPAQFDAWNWGEYQVVINAAAWTAVDAAETPEGRRGAWLANAVVPAKLAKVALRHRQILIHVSTDYVFDGDSEVPWSEDSPIAPLSVYGQSKAAGDLAVGVVPQHYLLRTSWVIGDGKNFVATMKSLAERGVSPKVVNDQFGRLTHTENLAAAIKHLLATNAPFGTYNCTDAGPVRTWAQVAKDVFSTAGRAASDVTEISTADYYAGQTGIAPRPHYGVLDLGKLEATGYQPPPDVESQDRGSFSR
jgi:dTDP-4-dehydrorhamnose 3,5-epimerase